MNTHLAQWYERERFFWANDPAAAEEFIRKEAPPIYYPKRNDDGEGGVESQPGRRRHTVAVDLYILSGGSLEWRNNRDGNSLAAF